MSFDLEIKEISYIVDDFDSSCLTLDISGKDVNYAIVNSLRKVCMDQIPTYGLDRSKINIKRNSSVYDNTEMEVRLSQLPLKRINHDVVFLPLKYYKNVNFADPKLEKHPNDTLNIELYLNIKNNNSDGPKYVSTDDLKIKINNEIIDSKKMYQGIEPITLIILRPGEEFECEMKGVLAVGELNGIFNASNSYYEEITENKYIFKIESSGQFDEYKLLQRGIEIIIEKLKIMKDNVINEQYLKMVTEKNSVKIEIVNEDCTCGGPVCHMLQSIDGVLFAGLTIPNFIEKNISITFVVDRKYKPFDLFAKAIDNTIEFYENLKKKVNKLTK